MASESTTSKAPAGSPAEEPPFRWALAFTLLSMDVVAPFFPLVGLNVPSPGRLVGVLRREIVRVRYEFSHPDPVAYDPNVTLAAIATAAGPEVRAQVEWWVKRILARDRDDHRPVGLWKDLLRHVRKNGLEVALGVPKDRLAEWREQVDRAFDIGPYEEAALRVFADRLSDWDLHLYAVNYFNDDDPGAPYGPALFVYSATMNFQAYRFWSWALRAFDPGTLRKVEERANALVEQTPELKYLGALAPVASLDIGAPA